MAGQVRNPGYVRLLALLVEGRHAAGLSQAQLARRLRKPPSLVAKYELAERRLDLVEVIIICREIAIDEVALLRQITQATEWN